MKAHYLSAKEKKAATAAAEMIIDQQAEDMVNRAHCMVYCAMLNAGLSVRTVNRVIKGLPYVISEYGKMRQEGLGDWDMVHGLIERGVKVNMTVNEL